MNKRNTQKGSSIVEMIVSFGILALAITAVILVSFGNQETAVGSELNNKALYLVEGVIEEAYADSIDDFAGLSDISLTAIDSIFSKELLVTPISQCAKNVEARITWNRGPAGEQKTTLTNVFTDIEASQALGGDCATEEATPWEEVGEADSESLSGFPATDIDVSENFIYLTTEAGNDPDQDFHIYEFNPITGTLTARGSLNTGNGLYAVDVRGEYAFVINKTRTTPPQPKDIWQLQVIKVTNPNSPQLLQSISVIGTGADGNHPEGISIYYYEDHVYFGTKESDEEELYVFDVSNPESVSPTIEKVEIGFDVRALVADEGYIYLATSNIDNELMVVEGAGLDLETDFGFDAEGEHFGSAITVLFDEIYFGLRREDADSDDDFYILEKDDVLDDTTLDDGIVGSADLGLANNSFITGIVVRKAGPKTLAFLGLDDGTAGLEIWNVTASPMKLNSNCTETNFSENSVGIDMEGKFVFTANRSNAKIRVLQDTEAVCTL
ncbi:MAG: hypothetical protein AAB458_01405 [Patescibacteria group bacterium]